MQHKQCTFFPDMSTESFAIIEEEKNNTIVRGFGNEILICEKQTNTTNRANTTDGKRNISIDMREACEISQVRSGNGSKPARKKCGKVSHHCMLYVVQYMSLESFHITPLIKWTPCFRFGSKLSYLFLFINNLGL